MPKIASFCVDHLTLEPGIYLSRIDGDVYTYDVRICKPYEDELLSNAEIHSLEHVLATIMRDNYGQKVVYVGPMGCQTGFYVLLAGVKEEEAAAMILTGMRLAAAFDGEMPGSDKRECGHCYNLSTDCARRAARLFLQRSGL